MQRIKIFDQKNRLLGSLISHENYPYIEVQSDKHRVVGRYSFGMDKTTACVHGRHVTLRGNQCMTVIGMLANHDKYFAVSKIEVNRR